MHSSPTFMLHASFLVLISFSTAHVANGKAPKPILPTAEQQKRFGKLYEKGTKLALAVEKIGQRLLHILNDDKAPTDHRVSAGRLLGQMRYLPAIPGLIRYIHLEPTETSEEIFSPLHLALRRFGDAAIPAIVEEILKYDLAKIRRKDLTAARKGKVKYARFIALSLALNDGGTRMSSKRRQFVRSYLAGLAAVSKDRTTRERAEAFLKQLDRSQKKNKGGKRQSSPRRKKR